MRRARVLALVAALLVLACTKGASAQQFSLNYSSIAALYGVTEPSSAAALAEIMFGLRPTDPRIAAPSDLFTPQQVLITYQSPSEVVISWQMGEPQLTPLNATSEPTVPLSTVWTGARAVKYGTRRSSLKSRVFATTDYYQQSYYFPASLNISGISGAQFNYTSAPLLSVRLTGLKPSTVYYYSLGYDTTVRSFRTAPAVGKFPFRLGSLADIGLSVNSSETVRKLTATQPDLALIVGDFAYANIFDFNGALDYGSVLARGLTYSFQPRWDRLGRLLQQLTSKTPILTTQGNHEMELQADGSIFKSWFNRYGRHSPAAQSSGTPFYYSADVGPVHIVSISSYVDFVKGTAQYDWLVRDLSSVDRSKTPWVVAMFHTPWYHTFVSHYKEAECHRIAVEPLLYKYGVNIVLSGHVHAYERTEKVYNYQEDNCGAVYLTVGNAGVGLNLDFADSASLVNYTSTRSYNASTNCTNPSPNQSGILVYIASGGQTCATPDPVSGKYCPDTQPSWSARREMAHGFVTIDFEDEASATLKYYRNLENDGVPSETITLTRDLSCANQVFPGRGDVVARRRSHLRHLSL